MHYCFQKGYSLKKFTYTTGILSPKKERKPKTCPESARVRKAFIEILKRNIQRTRNQILKKVALETGTKPDAVRDYCFLPMRRTCQSGQIAFPSFRHLKRMIKKDEPLPDWLRNELKIY